MDLVRITVDDRPPELYAVMAGIGVDAMMMDETDEDLKDTSAPRPTSSQRRRHWAGCRCG